MLHLLQSAFGFLNTLSGEGIKNRFKRESEELEQAGERPKGIPCTLNELLNSTDKLLEERCAAYDAAIYKELIQEDEQSNAPLPSWIEACVPRVNFSTRYSWEYAMALLKFIVMHPDAPVRPTMLLSLPNREISHVLLDLYLLILGKVKGSNKEREGIRDIKKRISLEIKAFVKGQEYEQDYKYILAFYWDALFLLLTVQKYTSGQDNRQNWTEARKYLSYYFANGLWLTDLYPEVALSFAKEGIALSNPADRQDAFNILGLCALETRSGKQLAYDAYLSWLRQTPVGLLEVFWPEGFVFGEEEEKWRETEGNGEPTATMLNNYAYVCDSIASTYELRSPERKMFQHMALRSINEAIEKEADPRYYRTCGLILADMNTPDKPCNESLELFSLALKFSEKLEERIPAMRLCCDAMIDNLLAMLMNAKQEYSQWAAEQGLEYYKGLKKRFVEYRQLLEEAQGNSRVEEREKRNAWKTFFTVQGDLHDPGNAPLELALLLIEQITQHIKKFLRRNAYSTKNYYPRDKRKDAKITEHRNPGRSIAYYTPIKTAMYLFDVLYRSSKDTAPIVIDEKHDEYKNGINCMTMMQAYYMNDPYEGLSFERGISGNDPNKNVLFYRGDAWQFREDIFQNNFVFLKSFTDRMDNLLMWNRYGSDRENGSRDSNGCCIRFDPEFFDRVIDSESARTDRNLLLDKKDDYCLYRVVYLDQKGDIEKTKNRNLDKNVKRCYTLLRQLLQYVNSKLFDFSVSNPNDVRIPAVRTFVQEALNPVIFLFKDDEYSDEEEYRLVVSRSHNELDKVRMLPGDPQKVCVNPYFQVCIDKVILGPNVEKPEYWFNHFRYHVANMWRRALGPNVPIPSFTVEKSSIHYHT